MFTIRIQKILTAFVMFLAVSIVEAQPQKPLVAHAPLPVQIAAAKKVFISYAGGDSNSAGYSGDAGRTYDQFYTAIKSWGHYEVVATPMNADLVLQINFDPSVPLFTLDIRDPRSNVLLWRLHQGMQFAKLTGNRDKNFDKAMDYLLDDVKRLAGEPIPVDKNTSKQLRTPVQNCSDDCS